MNLDLAPNDTAPAEEIALPLTDIAHLFNAPLIDPLSRSPAEVLGVSGVDRLLNLPHMDKRRQQARKLVLFLPPEKVSSASAEETACALRRVVELRIERERRELRGTYRSGWQMTGIAVILRADVRAAGDSRPNRRLAIASRRRRSDGGGADRL